MKLKAVKKFLSEELFPQDFTCNLCHLEIFDGHFCADCLSQLIRNDGYCCPVCGRRTSDNRTCVQCKAVPPEFVRAVSPFVYDGLVPNLVYGFKVDKPHLAGILAEYMAEKVRLLPRVDGLIFVPMTKREEILRDYNQSCLLAQSLSKILKLPVIYGAITKVKRTSKQKLLTRAERKNNLESCYKVNRDKVGGRTLLVVDDILTTGATLDAICGALKKAGAKAVYAATLASVEYSVAPKSQA